MEKADILHLGRLARIKIEEAEVPGLMRDITAVLEYVSAVSAIAGEPVKEAGPVRNVFREDVVTTEPGSNQEVLLAAAPKVERNMLVVKKILSND